MSDISEINTAAEMSELIKENAFRHTNYYHYSSCNAIKGILDSKTFWVSSMCFSNDKTEHKKFGEDTYRYFQLCFSTGTSENLPLWFLYSGINGKGLRIALTKAQINNLISFDKMELVLHNLITGQKTKLVPDVDCKISFKDVLYRKKTDKSCRIKYNLKDNYTFPKNEMQKFEDTETGFIKELIWYYEKETRLLIEVNRELLDKKLFEGRDDAPCRIELSIPEKCLKSLKITFSPAYDDEEIDSMLSDKTFARFDRAKTISEYKGNIKIDLCRKCTKQSKGELAHV